MNGPLVLCIMDGVGIRSDSEHNAVANAHMPFFNNLLKTCPHSKLNASGRAVGVPDGIMGNSEVGHITIGSGRVVPQFLERFRMENWDQNTTLNEFIASVKQSGGIVHFAGLMSDGKVHANISDEIMMMHRILDTGLRVCIHFIGDGRDTPPQSASAYIAMLESELKKYLSDGRAFFGTLSGRYYTMDRNKNLDRTEIAFNAIANGRAEFVASDIHSALSAAYSRGETDEFIKPTVITPTTITASDGFMFGNYRSDRARQILRAIAITGARMVGFSDYGEGLDKLSTALIPNNVVKNTLGDVLAAANLRQLRIAETEKYNHVTYFFDAERTIDFHRGEKILVPSPNVATFDMKPEMSAVEITDTLLSRLGDFDVIIMNYANGDMVGHTGNIDATVRAMECIDAQLARFVPMVLKMGGAVLITADHGNAEQMWDDVANAPLTSHTTNPVPFVVVGIPGCRVHDGGLSDIAPTMLNILGLAQPDDMTGCSLI